MKTLLKDLYFDLGALGYPDNEVNGSDLVELMESYYDHIKTLLEQPEAVKHIVISGTPTSGFNLIGPFSHPALATEWASTWEPDIDWWVAPIANPSQLEKERTNEHK